MAQFKRPGVKLGAPPLPQTMAAGPQLMTPDLSPVPPNPLIAREEAAAQDYLAALAGTAQPVAPTPLLPNGRTLNWLAPVSIGLGALGGQGGAEAGAGLLQGFLQGQQALSRQQAEQAQAAANARIATAEIAKARHGRVATLLERHEAKTIREAQEVIAAEVRMQGLKTKAYDRAVDGPEDVDAIQQQLRDYGFADTPESAAGFAQMRKSATEKADRGLKVKRIDALTKMLAAHSKYLKISGEIRKEVTDGDADALQAAYRQFQIAVGVAEDQIILLPREPVGPTMKGRELAAKIAKMQSDAKALVDRVASQTKVDAARVVEALARANVLVPAQAANLRDLMSKRVKGGPAAGGPLDPKQERLVLSAALAASHKRMQQLNPMGHKFGIGLDSKNPHYEEWQQANQAVAGATKRLQELAGVTGAAPAPGGASPDVDAKLNKYLQGGG